MKKINFKLNLTPLKSVEFTKGCVADINANGTNDDDFNGDGVVDGDDLNYYDAYVAGYNGDNYDSDWIDANHDLYFNGGDAANSGFIHGAGDYTNDANGNGNGVNDITQPDFVMPNLGNLNY